MHQSTAVPSITIFFHLCVLTPAFMLWGASSWLAVMGGEQLRRAGKAADRHGVWVAPMLSSIQH